MNELDIRELLEAVGTGKLSPGTAMERLKHMPFEDIGFAKVDHHRALRQGFAEVVFGKGKTPKQVAEIVRAMVEKKGSRQNVLVTRADEKMFAAVKRSQPRREISRALESDYDREKRGDHRERHDCGGVRGNERYSAAEEAVLTARMMGNRVDQVYDVGVAGIHRLLDHRGKLNEARVIVCVAGMEGVLPSVVGGLVGVPVIAVPTSTGYGASFGGVAALLGMLNSRASNVTVVNIDNGFGAACVASCINRL